MIRMRDCCARSAETAIDWVVFEIGLLSAI
jgi:hypothetical protein